MKLKSLAIWSALALLVATTTACQKTSPARPSDDGGSGTSSAVTDAVTGVTLTSPTLLTPTVNQQFKFTDQPITLTVKNAVTTGKTPLTYLFEVATDAAFASKVYSKDGVAEGSGQTSLKIDTLPGPLAKSYFWHARVTSGGLAGPFASGRGFGVGPAVTLADPVLAAPASGSTVSGQPSLSVNNVTKTGPAGQILYRFEVSTASSFASLTSVATVAEQAGGTTTTNLSGLGNGNYFWRVQASDPSNAITTAYSGVASFTVQLFDITKANFWDNPADFKSWSETSAITSIQFTDSAFLVDFDKRDGPNRWPDVGFGSGALEYTLGMCVNIRGTWNCSATVQFWYERDLAASGRPDEIGRNWWYDQRWGDLIGYQPACGETVGIYTAAGNLRDIGNVIAKERTNILFMPFCGSYSNGSITAAAVHALKFVKR